MTRDVAPTIPVDQGTGRLRVTGSGPWGSERAHAVPTPLRERPGLYERKPWLPPDLSGQILNNYRVIEQIGCGGMATVFRAEHIEIQKIVAIKVLQPRFARNPESASQFRKEAQAVCNLRHEHLVEVWDYGRTPDQLVYYILEYLDGQDLADTLAQEGPLPWPRVISIAKQICLALQAAHERDIIHRDIKPANCFRIRHKDNPDFIKVLDFGIAITAIEAGAGGGPRMGTPGYIAPELNSGQGYDNRVDIYSLGVLMHELLTGQLPERPAESVLDAHGQEGRTRCAASMVQALDEDIEVPAPLEMIILHAMAHDPDKRFRSAQKLYEALEDAENYLRTTPQPDMRATLPTATASSSHSMAELGAAVSGAAHSQVSVVSTNSRLAILVVVVITLAVVAIGQLLVRESGALRTEEKVVPATSPEPTHDEVTPAPNQLPSRSEVVPSAVESGGRSFAAEGAPETDATSAAEPDAASADETDAARAAELGASGQAESEASQAVRVSPKSKKAPAQNANSEASVPQITELSRKSMRKAIRRQRASLEACVEKFGGLTGRRSARVVVSPTGFVRSVDKLGGMSVLSDCCEKALRKMRFPKSRDGGVHTVPILPLDDL